MSASRTRGIIKPAASRWISDAAQPGWVEVDFIDASGQLWTVADKPSAFTRSEWTNESSAPPDCAIACDVTSMDGDEVVVEIAFGRESTGGRTVFTLNRDALGEWFHIPDKRGLAAMRSLDAVNWSKLRHAYGTGPGVELYKDVASSLAMLATEDFGEGMLSLYSSICHQGTVYPATAHAVPFLLCFAAGSDICDEHVERVVFLLAEIWVSATEPTDDGSRSGAFGEGVGTSTHTAFAACKIELCLIRSVPESAELIAVLVEAVEVGPQDADLVARLGHALDSRLN